MFIIWFQMVINNTKIFNFNIIYYIIMERKEKLATIYEKVANKELTFGCKIVTNEYNWDEFRVAKSGLLAIKEWEAYRTVGCDCCSEGLTIKEVIGHPVMISDILYWFEDKYKVSVSVWNIEKVDGMIVKEDYYVDKSIAKLLNLRNGIRSPIEEQSEELVDYVFSLL